MKHDKYYVLKYVKKKLQIIKIANFHIPNLK